MWIALTFREPYKDAVCLSTCETYDAVARLRILSPAPTDGTSCWFGLFEGAVVAVEPNTMWTQTMLLETELDLMVQIAAVSYPVLVDSGLVLTGYSTALVPVKLLDDNTILWHLEIAKHDSQIKASELSSSKGDWYKVENLDDLRSRKALVGWCAESITLLGTDQLGTVRWSNAKAKKTSWRWNGANLQFIATSTAPLQLGGQVGLTFERRPNMLRYNAAKNYLKCLNSSLTEHVVLYDCSVSRAWLVPLICVFHEMLLAYWRGLPDAYRAPSIPFAAPMSDGAEAAYAALRDCGGHVIEQSIEDRVTIRELILGFSANLFSTSLQSPGRSEIYGYEFMDIMKDSYATELKRRTITTTGVPWISLLGHFTCLFCSDLGDAIRGLNGNTPDLSCNQLPKGNDWLAVSMHSIARLNGRYGGDIAANVLQLSSQHYWLMQGLPFQRCDHAEGAKTFGCYKRREGLLRQMSMSRQNAEQSVKRASQNSTAITWRQPAKRRLNLAFTTPPDRV
ncbi:hypothetical protein BJX64DRAFT_299412 [Aspergillus heterothallicus]